MIDKLLHQHALLRVFSAELLEVLSSDTPCDQNQLAAARWKLVRMFLQHLTTEERVLYRPLHHHHLPEVALTAQSFRIELDRFYERFEEHMGGWTWAKIEADWAGYKLAVRHMVDTLNERMDREEVELFPHIDAAAEIATRSPDDRNWAAAVWTIREKLGEAA